METFRDKNIKTQFLVNGYKINQQFYDRKLVNECDEMGHKDCDT